MDLIIRILVLAGSVVGYLVILACVVAWLEARSIRKQERADSKEKSRR